MQNGTALEENSLACDLATLLLGTYPREMKTYSHTKPIYECSQ